MDLIRAYCRSPDELGFEHVVLVPTHGGNFAPVSTVAPDVAREIDANVIALADLDEHMARHEGPISTARLLTEGFESITENGVLGDPREGTPEAGEAIFDAVTAAYVDRIEAERDAVR